MRRAPLAAALIVLTSAVAGAQEVPCENESGEFYTLPLAEYRAGLRPFGPCYPPGTRARAERGERSRESTGIIERRSPPPTTPAARPHRVDDEAPTVRRVTRRTVAMNALALMVMDDHDRAQIARWIGDWDGRDLDPATERALARFDEEWRKPHKWTTDFPPPLVMKSARELLSGIIDWHRDWNRR